MVQIIATINPATGEQIKEFEVMSRRQVEEKIAKARGGHEVWKDVEINERMRFLKKLGRRFISHRKHLAMTMTEEMGKPIKEAVPEAEKCGLVCTYFGKHARKFLKPDRIKTEFTKSYVSYEPMGVVGAIMPWNFPMWQIMRCAAPAIAAGNTVVVKPSSVTPDSAVKIAELFEKCKFPDGVFNVVIGDASIGPYLVGGNIDAVSLTGSVDAGAKVASTAGGAIKKVVLELGGSDPFIVFPDAKIEEAAQQAAIGRFLNCGQSCIAAKRFIVHKDVAKMFTEKFIAATKSLKVGDPKEPDTDIGPLVREDQLQRIDKQVLDSVIQGAKTLLGGKRIEGKGFFYQPTVLGNVQNSMPVAKEEAFGPVAPIIVVEDEATAIQVANDTEYGLGASIWTSNLERAETLVKKIQAGVVYVNKTVRSDPRLPFGGVKKSGVGRELSRHGLREFVNVKSVIINAPGSRQVTVTQPPARTKEEKPAEAQAPEAEAKETVPVKSAKPKAAPAAEPAPIPAPLVTAPAKQKKGVKVVESAPTAAKPAEKPAEPEKKEEKPAPAEKKKPVEEPKPEPAEEPAPEPEETAPSDTEEAEPAPSGTEEEAPVEEAPAEEPASSGTEEKEEPAEEVKEEEPAEEDKADEEKEQEPVPADTEEAKEEPAEEEKEAEPAEDKAPESAAASDDTEEKEEAETPSDTEDEADEFLPPELKKK